MPAQRRDHHASMGRLSRVRGWQVQLELPHRDKGENNKEDNGRHHVSTGTSLAGYENTRETKQKIYVAS